MLNNLWIRSIDCFLQKNVPADLISLIMLPRVSCTLIQERLNIFQSCERCWNTSRITHSSTSVDWTSDRTDIPPSAISLKRFHPTLPVCSIHHLGAKPRVIYDIKDRSEQAEAAKNAVIFPELQSSSSLDTSEKSEGGLAKWKLAIVLAAMVGHRACTI